MKEIKPETKALIKRISSMMNKKFDADVREFVNADMASEIVRLRSTLEWVLENHHEGEGELETRVKTALGIDK